MVTVNDVVLRDVRDISNQLQLSMFILTTNNNKILSVNVILEAIKVNNDGIYI